MSINVKEDLKGSDTARTSGFSCVQVEKSFLQNEGGCRDGVNYEKGCQQEDALADNKSHTSIPTSFFRLLCIRALVDALKMYGYLS